MRWMKWNCGIRTLPIALLACAIAAPAAGQETTPAMLAAAAKEGKVVWYSSIDVKVAELIAKAFRADYPNIQIEVERSGSERVFQRINQEYQSGIKNVDVVNSSDASHFIYWKQQKWLAAHIAPDGDTIGSALTRGSIKAPIGALYQRGGGPLAVIAVAYGAEGVQSR